jgi:uncharacterized protein (DUF302 family)
MKTKKVNLPAVLFALILITGVLSFNDDLKAQSVEPVTVESSKDFEGTIEVIKKAVSGGEMMVLSELNQGNILSMTGLNVQAHSFFIGNPNVGKKAFSANPSVGVVIPVRVNVYSQNSTTYVNYFKPSELFNSYGKNVKMIGKKLDGKLEQMMKMISD